MKDLRQVECGRIGFIATGPFAGKLATIVEIVDHNRVLIDGPLSGVHRQAMNLKKIHLTKWTIRMPHGSKSKVVEKEWTKSEISKKWEESTWCQKLRKRAIRSNLTDFERFQVRRALMKRNNFIKNSVGIVKKAS